VAIRTGAFPVFGVVGHQQVVSGLMTGRAQFGLGIIRVGNLQRHMGFMAAQAVTLDHVFGMGCMAVCTVR